jgi:predicted transcriptional regulator
MASQKGYRQTSKEAKANAMNGWVKLHRQVIDNDIFRHDPTAWHVFEILLLSADSKTGKWSGGMFQLADLCGLNRNTLYKAILRLEETGMVNRSVNSRYTVYNISKWSEYQGNGKQSGKQPVNSQQTASNTLTRSKNKELEILSKDNIAYGNPDINELFSYWQERTGIPISSQVKANRNACSNLSKKHGLEGVKKLIDGVAQSQSDQYAPRIADFTQLQSKLSQLLLWGKQNITNRKVVKI